MSKFLVVGGKPFTGYTGTTTYTGLSVVGTTNTLKQAKKLFQKKWDECGGLLLIIDMTTGEAADCN